MSHDDAGRSGAAGDTGAAPASSALFRALFEQAADGLFVADADGIIEAVNAAGAELLGYRPAELVGTLLSDLLSAEDLRRQPLVGTALPPGGALMVERRLRRRDGGFIPVEVNVRVLSDGGALGIVRDISERRRSQIRVGALARLYALLSRINSAVMQSRDAPSMLQAVCNVAVEQGGFHMAWIGMVTPDSSRIEPMVWAGREEGYLALAFSSDPAQPVGSGPTGSAVREGNLVICEDIATDARMVAWRDAAISRGYRSSAAVPLRRHGRVVGSLNLYAAEVGFFTASERKLLGEIGDAISYGLDALDIALERKAMEAALRVSEDRLREVVRASHIGIFDHDHLNGEIYWSAQLRALYGFGAEEPAAMEAFIDCVHPDDRSRIEAAIAAAHDPSGDGLFIMEHRIITRDGTPRWLVTRSQTFFEDGHPVRTVGGVRDVTEEKRADLERQDLQDRLTQAKKMEMVGRLAGGVAHDFNNMLGVIIGHADLALAQLRPDDPIRDDLEQIQNAALRSSDLTRQLLAFARRQPILPRILDLNDAVESSLKLLRRLIGEHIELAWLPGKELWTVNMDPTQVVQVLTNLAVNARDAMGGIGDTGRVVIRTANTTLDEAFAASHPEIPPGPYVVLSVEDEGTGIEEDVLSHIFEPFFTTKEDGKGTGLGLATVYGIARQNDGVVTVESRTGKGTTVRVYLPQCGESAPDEADVARRPSLPQGDETVLLVEDEAALLALTHRTLEEAGYRVMGAADPAEALELLQRDDRPVDAAVLDVVMPGMSGADLSHRLIEMRPGLKCLFISGYPFDLVSSRNLLPPGVEFLQKPFTGHDLAVRVRELLDRR